MQCAICSDSQVASLRAKLKSKSLVSRLFWWGAISQGADIYAMIHFVEKTWGIHYVMGGTGLLSRLVTKFEELGGKLVCDMEVAQIRTEKAGAFTSPKLSA